MRRLNTAMRPIASSPIRNHRASSSSYVVAVMRETGHGRCAFRCGRTLTLRIDGSWPCSAPQNETPRPTLHPGEQKLSDTVIQRQGAQCRVERWPGSDGSICWVSTESDSTFSTPSRPPATGPLSSFPCGLPRASDDNLVGVRSAASLQLAGRKNDQG
jgi:hypothetical protein